MSAPALACADWQSATDAERARLLARPRSGNLQAFHDAVAQAEAEFRAEVGNEVATVVAIGLEAYAGGDAQWLGTSRHGGG